jgi:hypothetical protein
MYLIAPIFAFVLFACTPPPSPVVHTARVDARTENWQSQLVGASPGAAVHLHAGDGVALEMNGMIVYDKSLGGLRSKRSGPAGVGSRPIGQRGYCKRAPAGALIWRIGEDGQCMYSDDDGSVAFRANRDGVLQFIVNDRAESYGDNSGAYTITITVTPRQ